MSPALTKTLGKWEKLNESMINSLNVATMCILVERYILVFLFLGLPKSLDFLLSLPTYSFTKRKCFQKKVRLIFSFRDGFSL